MKNLLKNPFFYVFLLAVVALGLIISSYVLKPNSVENWSCGDSVNFIYRGSSVTYGTVKSQDKCWLDRDLGALQVATAYNDSAAYGDFFQWGRLDDGHQTRTSETTTTFSTTDIPGHSSSIKTSSGHDDWRRSQNDNLWQGVNGINNPCPSGWRIPTETEWEAELSSWNSTANRIDDAYASPLKLTAGGFRYQSDVSLHSVGRTGNYWSSTVWGTRAHSLNFYSDDAFMSSGYRALGYSVRCVQD